MTKLLTTALFPLLVLGCTTATVHPVVPAADEAPADEVTNEVAEPAPEERMPGWDEVDLKTVTDAGSPGAYIVGANVSLPPGTELEAESLGRGPDDVVYWAIEATIGDVVVEFMEEHPDKVPTMPEAEEGQRVEATSHGWIVIHENGSVQAQVITKRGRQITCNASGLTPETLEVAIKICRSVVASK